MGNLPQPAVFPVDLAQYGGEQGDDQNPATWTYDVTDALTCETLAGIQAHVESAERCTQGAVPHADAVGRVYLSSASAEHRAALDKTGEARATLDAARQEMRDMGGWGRRRTSCW